MSKPMVPRRSAKQIGDDDYGADSGDLFVTDSDATKLEAVVEAADGVRACIDVVVGKTFAVCSNPEALLSAVKNFDEARDKMGLA